jgi:phage baseplate assembly protein V
MMNVAGEHDRLIGNMLMWGVVAEIDASGAKVRVDANGMLTDWILWPELSAGPGVVTWCPPEVGTQVIIGCPDGETANAAVLARYYCEDYDAPADALTVHRTTYADGTVVEYDREAHRYKIDVGTGNVVINCKTAIVTATEKVTIDSPDTEMTGNLKVEKKIEAGEDITTPADVKAGVISLKGHGHMEQGDGNRVGNPIP